MLEMMLMLRLLVILLLMCRYVVLLKELSEAWLIVWALTISLAVASVASVQCRVILGVAMRWLEHVVHARVKLGVLDIVCHSVKLLGYLVRVHLEFR